MKRALIVTAVLAVLAFAFVGMWVDVNQIKPHLKGFPWVLLPLIMVFGFCNDLIKFIRWQIYLKRLGISIPAWKSLNIFISGLSMSATPGKIGFLIKSQMLKNVSGRPFLATTSVIGAELYMDLIALSVISLAGLRFLESGKVIMLLLCVIPLAGLIPIVPRTAVTLFEHIPHISHRARTLKKVVEDMFSLFGPGILLLALGVTLLAWTSEGVALHLIIQGMGFELGIVDATILFGLSTLIGVLSMLPGGLVVTDASLMGLLIRSSIPATPAALGAIMARLCTLWLSVIIGTLFLIVNRSFVYAQERVAKA
ncbi:MAG: lysylphosphatidylglycerol synthase transmembrane domain-containing protein [Desulfomonilia bacterium]